MGCIDIVLVKTFTELLSDIATVISVIILAVGLKMANNYVSKLKEKRNDSIFNFYSRLVMYLLSLKKKLGSCNYTPLLKKYSNDCLEQNRDNIIIPSEDEINEFDDFVEKFINFFMDTDNQIPLSISISTNIKKLREYLVKLTNIARIASYPGFNGNKPVEEEYGNITKTIELLLFDIENEQLKILRLFKIPKKSCLVTYLIQSFRPFKQKKVLATKHPRNKIMTEG
ncbi:MAG: hypothetical protein FWE23_00065 [Chitinivibrionia bacterium]|nr:hypothetical protein [Chitinivibrionia bacterium]